MVVSASRSVPRVHGGNVESRWPSSSPAAVRRSSAVLANGPHSRCSGTCTVSRSRPRNPRLPPPPPSPRPPAAMQRGRFTLFHIRGALAHQVDQPLLQVRSLLQALPRATLHTRVNERRERRVVAGNAHCLQVVERFSHTLLSMTSEKVLAKWPVEMSHSRYGECDFDPERAN